MQTAQISFSGQCFGTILSSLPTVHTCITHLDVVMMAQGIFTRLAAGLNPLSLINKQRQAPRTIDFNLLVKKIRHRL